MSATSAHDLELSRTQLDDYIVNIHWLKNEEGLIACTGAASLYKIGAEDQGLQKQVSNGSFSLFSSSMSAQGLLATGGDDGKCRIWNAAALEKINELGCKAKWVEHLSWNADGTMLAVCAGAEVQVFTTEGKLIMSFDAHESTIQGLTWNTEGTMLATACFGGARIFEPLKQSAPVEVLPWDNSIISLAWSADGKFLCGGTQECAVHFWSLPYVPDTDFEMSGYEAKIKQIAWNKARTIMVTPNMNQLVVWPWDGTPPTGKTPKILADLQGRITALSIQHESSLLAVGDIHGEVLFYEPTYQVKPLDGLKLNEEISCLSWSLDDYQLAIGTKNGTVVVMDSPA